MQVEVDELCKETIVIIRTKRNDCDIQHLVKQISHIKTHPICGIQESRMKMLEEEQIYRIYSENGKVYADTQSGIYQVKQRLYELEHTLDESCFVRINHSEIINIDKADHFDVSLAGTIKVTLQHGIITYVSRRNISKIKQVLGR